MLSILFSWTEATALTWDSDANGTNGPTDGPGIWAADGSVTNWYPGGLPPQTNVVWTTDNAVIGSTGVAGVIRVSAPADTTYQVLESVVVAVCAGHPALRV
ncbi:MAG: hypothetical protein AAF492_24990, partial [Verrucomicrobiota bacterium]